MSSTIQEPYQQRNSVVDSLLDDATEHFIGKRNFALGLAYANFTTRKTDVNYLMDETYFKVDFYKVQYTDTNDSFDRNLTQINMTQCTTELFPYAEQKLYDRLLIDRYLCPISNEYSLMGDSNSETYKNVEVFISK